MCLSVCFCERAHICAVIADWWSCGVRGPIVYPLSVCVCVYAIEWHLPPAHRRVVVNQCANHISCLPNPINSTAKIDRKYIANTTIARAQHTHIHTNTHPASTMSKKQILHPRVTNEIIEIKSKVSPPSLHLHPHSLRSFFCVCCVWRIRVPSRVQCSYPYECVTLYRNMHHKQPEYIHAVCVREFLCVCVQHKCISFLRECRLRRAHTTCAWIYGKLNCADAKVCAIRTAISLFVSPLAAVCAGLGLDYIVCMC